MGLWCVLLRLLNVWLPHSHVTYSLWVIAHYMHMYRHEQDMRGQYYAYLLFGDCAGLEQS